MKYLYLILIVLRISAQSLDSIIAVALSEHNLLRAIEKNKEQMMALSEASSYLPNPDLMISYFKDPLVTANGPQKAVISLKQKLPVWGQLSHREESLKHQANSYKYKLVFTREKLKYGISKNYYRLAAVQEKITVLEAFREILQTFYQSALVKYEHGLGNQHDVIQAQQEISKTNSIIISFKIHEKDLQSNLRVFLSRDFNDITASLSTIKRKESGETAKKRGDLLALEESIKSAKISASAFSLEALPQFSLGLQYFLIDEKAGITGNQDAIAVQLGISIPVFSAGISSKSEAALLKSQVYEYQYMDKVNELRSNVKYLKEKLQLLEDDLDLLVNDLIPKSEMLLESGLSHYETGKVDFLRLIDAEENLLNHKLSKIDKDAQYLTLIAELEFETSGNMEN